MPPKPRAKRPPPPRPEPPLFTPDGRYLVVRGRLWRRTNPNLPEAERVRLVGQLSSARRAIAKALRAGDAEAEHEARGKVHSAKVALGERRAGMVEGRRARRDGKAREKYALCGLVRDRAGE